MGTTQENKVSMEATGEQLVVGSPLTAGRTEKEHLSRYDFALSYIKGKRVLDIACGTGYGAAMLKEAGATSVDGIDISREAISYARSHYLGINFNIGDAQIYCSPDTYDVIVSFETIEHVTDYKETLSNYFTSLKNSGMLILSTPNRLVTSPNTTIDDTPTNPYHVREFSITEIIEAVRDSGFKIDANNIFAQCQPLSFKNRYVQKLNKTIQHYLSRYSPQVKPIHKVSKAKYIVLVARKIIS
jgi:SAM-dependent methyltransferase